MPDVTRIIEQKPTESIYNDDWAMIDRPTEGEDGGTRKILVSKLKELLCGDYIADEWESLVTYNYGRFVTHEGKLYYNNSGGALVQITFNSNAWLEVRIDELLEKLIGSIGEKWRRVDTYRYDDLVVYGGRLYRCIKNASTQGTWVSNEWIEANAEYYFKKVREYIARYDFVPSGEAVSSPYNKGDLILYRASGDTTNSLYMRLNDTEYGDPTWIPENWLKVENIGGALSKIYDDMEESSCDVQIKEQSIVDENHVADLTSLAAVGSASGEIATFDDGSDLPMPSLKVGIEPQQDLHGYDAPWVGGAGKNKLQVTATTATKSEVTFTVKEDGTIVVTGTKSSSSSTRIWFDIAVNISFPNDVILNGCPSDGGATTYKMAGFLGDTGTGDYNDIGSGVTIPANTMLKTLSIGIAQQGNINLVFKPMIRLASVADATFAPYSNICPISGWDEVNVGVSGKNLFGGDKFADDVVRKVENASKRPESKTCYYAADKINKVVLFTEFKPSTRYSFYFPTGSQSTNLEIVYSDGSFTTIGTTGVTVSTESKNVIALRGTWYTGTTTINYEYCGIIEGVCTVDDFLANTYNGNTYKVEFKDGDNPLTVYGGTLDVVSGVLTVDMASVDLGSLTWTYSSTYKYFYTTDLVYNYGSKMPNYNMFCELYKCLTAENAAQLSDVTKDTIMVVDFHVHNNSLNIRNLAYTDVATFKTAMSGVYLVYELATPITYQLTPTQVKSLLGTNNVWADTGDVLDAEYIRDMTTIINSLIARIEALENQ